MIDKPFLSPGCFGIGQIYKADAKECMSCPFKAQCHPVAEANLARLRAKFGVKPPEKPKLVPKAPGPTVVAPGLPKKVHELMQRVQKAGINVRDKIAAGENPFSQKWRHHFITSHLLLKMPDGLYRDVLQKQLTKLFGWDEKTAASLTLQAVQLLEAYGVAEEKSGRVKLRRVA